MISRQWVREMKTKNGGDRASRHYKNANINVAREVLQPFIHNVPAYRNSYQAGNQDKKQKLL